MFLEVKMLEDRSSRFEYNLNCKTKNRSSNVFTIKQKTNKLKPKIYRGLQVTKKVLLLFWRPNDSMKGKFDAFSGNKQRNMVRLLHLEFKP